MQKSCLLDCACDALRVRHHSICTEESYLQWITRFILFHNKRHAMEIGEAKISTFLTHLAVDKHVAAST